MFKTATVPVVTLETYARDPSGENAIDCAPWNSGVDGTVPAKVTVPLASIRKTPTLLEFRFAASASVPSGDTVTLIGPLPPVETAKPGFDSVPSGATDMTCAKPGVVKDVTRARLWFGTTVTDSAVNGTTNSRNVPVAIL